MKLDTQHILYAFYQFATLLMAIGMLSLPTISMFSSLADEQRDFIELHDEKESGEQEKLEENNKNEKKNFQVVYLEFCNIYDLKVNENYKLLGLKLDFILEIPIPPPDFIS